VANPLQAGMIEHARQAHPFSLSYEAVASHRIGTAMRPDQKKRMQGSQSPKKPSNIPAAFKQALSFHQTGQLGEAESIYRQILETQPQHFDSLHLLGVVYHQRGKHAEAVRQIDVALQINPKDASAFNNRGIALRELRRLDEALASY